MCAICEFRIEFSISHPQALSVAMATRRAIEAGQIAAMDIDDGALAAARRRMSAVDALNLLQARIEDTHATAELRGLPDFYVLLIEDDTWGFFHATQDGFDPDVVPGMPDVTSADELKRSNVVIMSEAALRAWFDCAFDLASALRDSLFVIDAPCGHRESLARMLATAGALAIAGG